MSKLLTEELFRAISAKNEEEAIARINLGAFMNMSRKVGDESGVTALHMAASLGLTKVVKALLDKGHNVHLCTSRGWTAMHEAAKSGHKDIMALLYERGANIRVRTDEGASALLLAVVHDKFEAGIYALDKTEGAILKEPDLLHNTSLHAAIINNRKDFLRYFLDNYSHIVKGLLNTPGMDGNLPLHMLVTADPDSPFFNEFIELGANPRTQNKEQERPSQLAQRYGISSTTKALREKEFPLFYLCCKKVVQNEALLAEGMKDLPDTIKESLNNVKAELELELEKSMSRLYL